MICAFEPDDSASFEFAVKDSLINLARVTELLPSDEAALDALFERCQQQDISSIWLLVCEQERLGIGLTASLLRISLGEWIPEPFSGKWGLTVRTLRGLWESGVPAEMDTEDHRMAFVFDVIIPISELSQGEKLEHNRLIEIATAFLALAEHLARHGEARATLGCAQSAAHFFQYAGENVCVVKAARLALEQAEHLKDAGLILDGLVQLAIALSVLGRADQKWRLEAFDAWERLSRFAILRPECAGEISELATAWFCEAEWLQGLRPFLYWLQPASERTNALSMTDELMDALCGLYPIWQGDVEATKRRFLVVSGAARAVEEQRQVLHAAYEHSVAIASWATFDFDHAPLRRAVPVSSSIFNEQRRDDLLLLLAHEITHVVSMLGRIGTTSWALRWAIFQLEVGLLRPSSTRDSDQLTVSRFFQKKCPVRLPEHSQGSEGLLLARASLARAKQQLEVGRKLQLFENIWAPWFEGLAVFAELGADPRDNPLTFTAVTSVLVNLMDRSLNNEAKKRGCSAEEAVYQLWAEAEALLGEAQKRIGRPRLLGYLDRNWPKYLAGVCAVRAVVASWRHTLARPISGAEAFAVLLHATRHATADVVPDVALPVEEFCQQLVSRQLSWLRNIASVPREDLQLLLNAQDTGERDGLIGWRGNRAIKEPVGHPLAPDLLQIISRAAGEASILDEQLVNQFLTARFVLPIGRAECPYWLARASKAMALLIRTREQSAETGKPSFNALYFPLPPEIYDSLEERVRLGAPSRLKTTRVALLTNLDDSPSVGRNFLVFQTGGWLHIQNAGVLFSSGDEHSAIVDAIRSRLAPTDVVAAYEAITAPDHPYARRTLEWVQTTNWVSNLGAGYSDLRPLAEHTADVAKEILKAREQDDAFEISQELLGFVLGDSRAANRLAREGLTPLRDANIDLSEFIRMLDASARRPVAAAEKTDLVRDLTAAGFPLLVSGPDGIDFTPPLGLC